MTSPQGTPSAPKRKRWGWRTLGFLVLGMVAGFTAMAQGFQTWGTLGCLIVALAGAGYCSYRGIRQMLAGESRHVR